jgi:hypothetical protein
MSKETMKLALEAAYLAGFNATGEGYNGEYGIGYPEQDVDWIKNRNEALAAIAPFPTTELLQALQAAVATQAYRPGEGPDWWENARAAIAKATGAA